MFDIGSPSSDVAKVLDQLPASYPEDWAKWDNVRSAHIRLLERELREPPPKPEFRGVDGIVTCVSAKPGFSSGKSLKNGYLPGGYVLVRELRRLGCNLPICVGYLGDIEMDPAACRAMESVPGVTCLDLTATAALEPYRPGGGWCGPRILNGWESKSWAIISSGFRRAMFLDADNTVTRDPTYLFRSQQFTVNGAVFWPDVPPHDRTEWLPDVVWANVGMEPCPNYIDFESGQLMIDLDKCWRQIWATKHINDHSDWYYKFVFGDKSTFHLAWAKAQAMRLGGAWSMPEREARGWIGSLEQHDFAGKVLFQHGTRNKPDRHGYPAPQALIHRSHCESHLADLRKIWSGEMWENIAPSDRERELSASLASGMWVYDRVGLGERFMSFIQSDTMGRIGAGIAGCEVSWSVFDRAGVPTLYVKNADGALTFSAVLTDDGVWRGQWVSHERCNIILRRT